jgi:hypothetical protein
LGEQGAQVREVDAQGIRLTSEEDLVLDVRFDDRRIWSFWTLRDTEPREQHVLATWPPQLSKYLDGTTRLSVVEHVSGRRLFDEEVSLGEGDGRIAVVDAQGRELGIDKSNRLTKTFDTSDTDQVTPLLDAIEVVLAALRDAGVEAFLAYGTLLGAVREGDFIGHDSDIDLGYVSRCTHPLDVVRESFRLQRELNAKGLLIDRYSGAAFKVTVVDAAGSDWGLDVFGGFLREGRLYLMGEIGTPYAEEWVFPLTTSTLAGRTLPVPAVPEKLLEAMYGPSWRVPDPAFHFETPLSTVRRLNGWFRGTRTHRAAWDRVYSGKREVLPRGGPSALARFVRESESDLRRVVDVGAGRGRDALWFARKGIPTLALDHARGADTAAQRAAAEEGLAYESAWLNLHELRSAISNGARVAHLGGPPTVIANHLLDATDRRGMETFLRFCRMSLSGGGRLYTEFLSAGPDAGRGRRGEDRLQSLPVAGVTEALRQAGADIVHSTERHEQTSDGSPGRPVARLVAQWRS